MNENINQAQVPNEVEEREFELSVCCQDYFNLINEYKRLWKESYNRLSEKQYSQFSDELEPKYSAICNRHRAMLAEYEEICDNFEAIYYDFCDAWGEEQESFLKELHDFVDEYRTKLKLLPKTYRRNKI